MIVRYLTENDYDIWNRFVDESPQGFIWDYSWWLQIVTDSDFRICALFDDDNLIVAGLTLPYYSTKYIHQPPLTQSLGVLYENMEKRNNMRLQKQLTKQKEYSNQIFDFVLKDIKKFIIQFNYNYDYWLPLYWKGFKQTTLYTYVIDYSNYVLDEEFKRFSKGHKWILNRVEKKSDLVVKETDDVEEYLVESDKTYQRQNVKKPYSNELVRLLYKECKKRCMSTILKIVDSANQTHAVAIYLHNKNEVYYWLGASDENLRESGGHTYLTWYAIRYFSDKVRYFNFGGSMLEAVERNFRNFSATPRQYFRIQYGFDTLWQYSKNVVKKILNII